jgi:hypothetical protein
MQRAAMLFAASLGAPSFSALSDERHDFPEKHSY